MVPFISVELDFVTFHTLSTYTHTQTHTHTHKPGLIRLF